MNIDAQLLARGGEDDQEESGGGLAAAAADVRSVRSVSSDASVAMQGGCICCTLKDDLLLEVGASKNSSRALLSRRPLHRRAVRYALVWFGAYQSANLSGGRGRKSPGCTGDSLSGKSLCLHWFDRCTAEEGYIHTYPAIRCRALLLSVLFFSSSGRSSKLCVHSSSVNGQKNCPEIGTAPCRE